MSAVAIETAKNEHPDIPAADKTFHDDLQQEREYFSSKLMQKLDNELTAVVNKRVDYPERIVALVEHKRQTEIQQAANCRSTDYSKHNEFMSMTERLAQQTHAEEKCSVHAEEKCSMETSDLERMKTQIEQTERNNDSLQCQLELLKGAHNYWL